MCTAISFQTKDHYFGRNLDLEYSHRETVTVTPRNYPLRFRKVRDLERHYALIGMAFVAGGYPLYYEAANERGLSMAGLNFPGNACYRPEEAGKDNVSPFEFIPWVLGQCASVGDAMHLLGRINLTNLPFSDELPLSPLHWILCDRNQSVVIEAVKEGLKLYNDPVGVLTNNPTFDFHMTNLSCYMGLSRKEGVNRFAPELELQPFSRGMGAMGLPGDLSSSSRFVRAAFHKFNSVCGEGEDESVSHFFHLLDSAAMPKGSMELRGGVYEYTLYSCCCNTTRGIYYYKTYGNSQITAVDLWREDLERSGLIVHELVKEQQILRQN